MNKNPPIMYALLVGINQYASPNLCTLGGCIDDVDAMEQLLRDRFDVPQTNIKKLTDSAATHQAIKSAFRSSLIEPARAWAVAGRQGMPPTFLFHFSGHGSQAVDLTGIELDRLDETIVPYDSRTPGIYDIKDWELAQLLDELTAVSDNVTVILDCCHSGTGVRDIAPSILPARRCEPDYRPQPTQRPETTAQTRGAVTASGWMPVDRYVLLAACRDKELANEIVAKEGDQRRQHGALTYFLIRELAQMNPDRLLTYRELHEQVRDQVNMLFPAQMPQCEGDRERDVFGGVRPAHTPMLTVVGKSEGLIWIDGGIAHGLTEGSELHVYPPDTRMMVAAPPLAVLAVQRVGAVRSGCVVLDGEKEIPLHARVALYRLDPGTPPQQVLLDIPAGPICDALRTRFDEPNVKNHVQEVSAEKPADFRIQLTGDQLQLQDGTGRPLVAAYSPEKTDELIADLMHLVRYFRALDLRNRASDAALANAVKLAIKRRTVDPATQEPISTEFELSSGGELVIDVSQEIVLEITNRYHKPLYIGLFEFGYEWDIVQWYPETKGAHEAFAPGKTLSIGLRPDEQIALALPENVAEVRETFKVIATVKDADFDILTMEPLKTTFQQRDTRTRSFTNSPLDQILDLAMENQPDTRAALRHLRPSFKDEWTTAQVGFLVTRPSINIV